MLQSMREKMQGIIAGAIVVLIAITFALWGIQYYTRGSGDIGVIAKVNGEKITEQQVYRIYSRAQQQKIASQGKDFVMDQKAQTALKDEITQQLINSKVLLSLTDTLNLFVGKEQLQVAIMSLPLFQSEGKFSSARFQQVLSNLAYTEQDFLRELQGTLLLGQLELGIIDSSFVLSNEVDDAIRLNKQTRDFDYVLVQAQQFASQVTVSEDDIKKYYEQHQRDFETQEKVSVEYIEFNANTVKNKIDLSDAKLEKFYQEHIDAFSSKGASTGKTPSAPTSTPAASTTKAVLPFAKVKAKVRELYERQAAQQLLAEQHEKLTDLTYTNSNSLEPAAKELGLTIKTTEMFTHAGTATGITANPKFVKAAFSESVLKQGYNSNLIDVGDNNIIVLRIKQRQPETILPLDKVRAEVVAKVKQRKMSEMAKAEGEKLLQALKDQQKVESNSLVWRHVARAGRMRMVATALNTVGVAADGGGVDSIINGTAFALPVPQENRPSLQLIAIPDRGYAIIKVTKVYDGDYKNVDAGGRNAAQEKLQNDYGKFEYHLMENEAVRQADVKRYDNNNSKEAQGNERHEASTSTMPPLTADF
jgi:hypothetical protein